VFFLQLFFFCDHNDAKDEQKQAFAAAMKMWSDVTNLTFSEVNSASSADLKIRQVKSLIHGL